MRFLGSANGIVTVKKISLVTTGPAGAGKPPYLIGAGEGSFDFDTRAGCVRSYSFAVKVVVEGDPKSASTASLTYQRLEGNALASLPPAPLPRSGNNSSASPGSGPRPAPRSRGSSPPSPSEPTPHRPAPVAAKPVEVPPVAARSQATKLLNDLFKKELAALDSSAKRIALARTLLKQAAGQRPGTADHYVLLEKAYDLAMLGGDVGLTCQVIDQLTSSYQLDGVQLKGGALASLAETATKPNQQRKLALMALDLLDRAIAADDIEGGRKLGKIAYTVARKSDDKALIAQTAERGKAFKEIQKSFEDFQHALVTLKTDSKNATASTLAGKYYCFVKDDWKQGLPLLAQGNDAGLAATAAKELAAPTDGAALFDLAESWDDLAETEHGLRHVRLKVHARTWYQKALPSLDGLARVKAERTLAGSPPNVVAASVSGYRPAGDLGRLCDRSTAFVRAARLGGPVGQPHQHPRNRRQAEQNRVFRHSRARRALDRLRHQCRRPKDPRLAADLPDVQRPEHRPLVRHHPAQIAGETSPRQNGICRRGNQGEGRTLGRGVFNRLHGNRRRRPESGQVVRERLVRSQRRRAIGHPGERRRSRRGRHSGARKCHGSELARAGARAEKVTVGDHHAAASRRSSGTAVAGSTMTYSAAQKSQTTTFSRRSFTIFTYS